MFIVFDYLTNISILFESTKYFGGFFLINLHHGLQQSLIAYQSKHHQQSFQYKTL